MDIMRELFENEAIDASCGQANCDAWDSLHHLNLVVELEEAFGIEFEPEEIASMRSFAEVLDMVEGKVVAQM